MELSFWMKRLSSATYVTQKSGMAFPRTLLFVTTVKVSTDRLLISDEALRALDRRE